MFTSKFRYAWQRRSRTLVVVVLLVSFVLPSGLARAEEPVADPDSTPHLAQATLPDPAALPGPDAPVVSFEELRRLGVPEPSDHTEAAAADSSIFTPFNFYPYYRSITQIGGGWRPNWSGWSLNQILSQVDRIIYGTLRNPIYWGRSLEEVDAAQVQEEPFGLPMLNGIHSGYGNWNQFQGAQPYPGELNTDAGSSTSDPLTSLVEQAVLGYAPQAVYASGTEYEAGLRSLYTPWNTHSPWTAGVEMAAAQAPEGTSASPMTVVGARYREIGQQQLDAYYTDSGLSALRTEYNQVVLYLVNTDPWYVYWAYRLNYTWQQILVQQPSYASYQAVTQEIASWTTASEDPEVLQYRYQRRLLLQYLQGQVQAEALAYIRANPQLEATMKSVAEYLSNRLAQLWQLDTVVQWYNDWLARWNSQHQAVLNNAQTQQQMQQLFSQAPAFQEYVELNSQMSDLLPGMESEPEVEAVQAKIVDVLYDQNVAGEVSKAYNEYQTQLNELLGETQFTAELERYWERSQVLAASDSVYIQLLAEYQQLTPLWSSYQQQLYEAVAACVANYGQFCNPYNYQPVVALITSNAAKQLFTAQGNFQEKYRLYRYNFYVSVNYKEMEQDTQTRIQNTLSGVRDDINRERNLFVQSVNSISSVRDLRTSSLDLVSFLRGETTGRTGNEKSAAFRALSAEFDSALDRMTNLVAALTTPPAATPGGPYRMDEGSTLALSGSGSRPGGGIVSYAWDLNDDGVFETTSQNPSFDARTLGGPASLTVALKVTDENGGFDVETTTVTIDNVPPVAQNDSASTSLNKPVTIHVLANDVDVAVDPLSVASVTQGSNGTVVIGADRKSVVYTPGSGFGGQDSFNYIVSDGHDSAIAAVTVTVQPDGGNPPNQKLFLPFIEQ